MSERSKPEEDLQYPGEAQGPVEVPLLEAEVGESACHLASYALASSSANVEALPQEILDRMMANLMKFLLLKYRAKELTSQAEILDTVLRDNQGHFLMVFREVSECLKLVFGVDVKEVDPAEHTYILVPTLGLTCDEMLSDGEGLPKAGFLVLVVSMIMWFGDPAPEEAVWGALSRMGVYVGREHCVFGEPRELLTQLWVQEGYLRYQQVPDSHPAR
ncbi:melanoma-associated antigen 10-like [Muntiacus reevesi]|uniref:melanoma-associated antigen 10-like n=1 Tax=Muntiacus reevesi TaxID=9886 RepID=UPI00330771F8